MHVKTGDYLFVGETEFLVSEGFRVPANYTDGTPVIYLDKNRDVINAFSDSNELPASSPTSPQSFYSEERGPSGSGDFTEVLYGDDTVQSDSGESDGPETI